MSLSSSWFHLMKRPLVSSGCSIAALFKVGTNPVFSPFILSLHRHHTSCRLVCSKKFFTSYIQNDLGKSSFFCNPITSLRKCTTKSKQTISDGEKDVLVYKYQNERYFNIVNIFGYVMWVFGIVASSDIYGMEIKTDDIDGTNIPWYAVKFRSETTKSVFAGLAALIGLGSLVLCWMYSARSVAYLVLRKGGQQVTFVTYNPAVFKKYLYHTAEISDVSCQGSRGKADLLPLKVKGKWFHFLLSKDGVFTNAELFDKTVGLKRKF